MNYFQKKGILIINNSPWKGEGDLWINVRKSLAMLTTTSLDEAWNIMSYFRASC